MLTFVSSVRGSDPRRGRSGLQVRCFPGSSRSVAYLTDAPGTQRPPTEDNHYPGCLTDTSEPRPLRTPKAHSHA